MTVRQLLDRKGRSVHTVRPDQTVREAVRLLMQHRIGSLVVLEGETVVGIITERDVLGVVEEQPDSIDTMPVWEAMTRDVWIASEDTPVADVERGMTVHHVRHLPVLDDGRLVGLISIGDVLKIHVREVDGLNQELVQYISGAYPA